MCIVCFSAVSSTIMWTVFFAPTLIGLRLTQQSTTVCNTNVSILLSCVADINVKSACAAADDSDLINLVNALVDKL